jgi:RNA polymerase sigma-70 factor (ECF subfamily)
MLVDNPIQIGDGPRPISAQSSSEPLGDQQLVLQSQQGDSGAFRQLYRRHHPKVRSTLYQLCGSQRLDDLVQEVFLLVWKGLPQLRQRRYFATWLYRITWNVAQDERKALGQAARHQAPEEALLESVSLSRSQDSPDLMHLHYQDLVWRGLQHLSFEHRTVLVLHDLEDLPQKTVADILQLPTGTIKSRLFYARQAIRQYLQAQGVQDAF